MKYSIIIPTYNHCDDLLKPAVSSILQYSNISDIELIISANGCTDNTRDYLNTLIENFAILGVENHLKVVWHDSALGYARAVNEGIKVATTNRIVPYSNDVFLLEQPKNHWLDRLSYQFEIHPNCGISSVLKLYSPEANRTFGVFFCVMIDRKVIDTIGLISEEYDTGGCEDIDFCIRAEMAGFEVQQCCNQSWSVEQGTHICDLPIHHFSGRTVHDTNLVKDYNSIFNKNALLLAKKYNPDYYNKATNTPPKYSIVIPTYNHCDDLLKPCIESIFKYTHMSSVELIVSANGCTDNTKEYLESLGDKVKVVWNDNPLGYPLAVNAGLEVARGDLVILLNNDTVLLEQQVNTWLSILEKPFAEMENVGITGPIKFIYDCNGIDYDAMGFWLVMIKKEVIDKIGMLDPIFSPGMGEDTDFCIRTTNEGYKLVAVPQDVKFRFGGEVGNLDWPIYHKGNGTFDDCRELKNSTIKRNDQILYDRYGPTSAVDSVKLNIGMVNVNLPGYQFVDLHKMQSTQIDISQLGFDDNTANEIVASEILDFVDDSNLTTVLTQWLKVLKPDGKLVLELPNIEERYGKLIVSANSTLKTCGWWPQSIVSSLIKVGYVNVSIMPQQLSIGENYFRVEAYKPNTIKYSIVIPTYNHCDDLLAPCVNSIKKYTDLSTTEILIVANGCTDNTREYAESLPHPFKLIWSEEALGYTKATNLGIAQARGEFVVLLNNDTELLPQEHNSWLDQMASFFNDPQMGIVGPLVLHDDYSDFDCVIFFCAMIRRQLFDTLGLLDEIYTPGGGEDIDFSARVQLAGYKIQAVCATEYSPQASTNVGQFPIWHKDNQTFKHISEYGRYIMKRNGLINAKRFNKNIKLNLGAGGINYPGYLSVDLHDHRAHILMDVTRLDFDDNTVVEILASHLFEHLDPKAAPAILKEWLRVLKPGGKLVMEMPDIEQLCHRFINANTGDRYGIVNVLFGSVNTTEVGGPDNITSPHRYGWWPQSISQLLTQVGYTSIEIMDEKIPHPANNFRVEATKPIQ